MDSKVVKPDQQFIEGLMLYLLKLILNSNQDLVLFRQTHILRVYQTQKLTETNQRAFSIQLFNPCLHFTNNKLTLSTRIEEIFKQSIILNPHANLNFSSKYPTKNITDKFTIIRSLCQFLPTWSHLLHEIERETWSQFPMTGSEK